MCMWKTRPPYCTCMPPASEHNNIMLPFPGLILNSNRLRYSKHILISCSSKGSCELVYLFPVFVLFINSCFIVGGFWGVLLLFCSFIIIIITLFFLFLGFKIKIVPVTENSLFTVCKVICYYSEFKYLIIT